MASDKIPCTVLEFNGGSALERFVGGAAASVFSITYIIAPIYVFLAFGLIFLYPSALVATIALLPLVLTYILPSTFSPGILGSWPMQCIPKYFNYSEIKEIDDAACAELMKTKGLIFTAQPHGVISFGGIASAITRAKNPWLAQLPTAAASVILLFPFLRNVLGIFGLCDASKGTLTKRLSGNKSFVLYLGGIAELFLSSPTREALYLKKRAGFIKLALTTGADVIPLYLFGNTTVLSVLTSGPLAALSRKLQVSVTLFWGTAGLPIPRPRKLLYVRGRPLGLPKVPKDQVTDAMVAEWHGKYMEEVQRIYTTYQKYNPDYIDKPLIIQ